MKNLKRVLAFVFIMVAGCIFLVGCGESELVNVSVDTNSISASYEQGDTIDLSNVKLTAEFYDGTKQQISIADCTYKIYNSANQEVTVNEAANQTGTYKVVFYYNNKTAEFNFTVTNNTSLNVSGIVVISSSIKTIYYVDEVPDFSTLVVKAVLFNSNSVVLDESEYNFKLYNADNEQVDLTTFTSEIGTYSLVVTYNGLRASISITVAVDPEVLANNINHIFVNATSIQSSYEQNSTVDFSDMTITAVKENGSEVVVGRQDFNLTIKNSDNQVVEASAMTSVLGSYTLTVEYNEKTAEFVVIVVEPEYNPGYEILGFETPLPIVSYRSKISAAQTSQQDSETWEAEFYAEDENIYLVGDDNDFIFLPEITNDNYQTLTAYRSVTTVYIKDDNDFVALTRTADANRYKYTDADNVVYVYVDEYKSSFKFTEDAVNKVFKISVVPYIDQTFDPVELEVKVVNGYNVYNANQLSVIDNTQTSYWQSIKSANNIATDLNVNAVVLHNDIEINNENIPSVFLIYNTNNEVIGLKERLNGETTDIYHHTNSAEGSFKFYGNYFTIDASNVALIPTSGDYGYGSDFSNAALFKFEGANTKTTVGTTNTTIKNINFKGNANRSEEKIDGKLKYAGGLILFKSRNENFNMDNCIIKTFFINAFAEYESFTNLNKIKSYDSFQNALFVFGGSTINLSNSEMKRAGGPLMILQHVDPDENLTTDMPVFNSVDCVLESYCDGEEAWFSANSADGIASQIKALSAVFKALGGKSLEDSKNSNKMNLISLVMSNGVGTDLFNASLMPYVQGKVSITKGNDTYVMDKLASDREDPSNVDFMLDYTVNAFLSGFNYQAPVFSSLSKDVAFISTYQVVGEDTYVGETTNYGLFNNVDSNYKLTWVQPTSNFFAGDYINLYYYGLGITMGFYSAT